MKLDFWDRKIIGWEESRYNPGVLISKSICYRLETAAYILQNTAAGMSLADLGCGTGRLFQRLQGERFSRLVGVDISRNAILEARKRTSEPLFICGDITTTTLPDVECYVGLGLLDWLEDHECAKLFARIGSRRFLFSFSEKRAQHLRLLHALFLALGPTASEPYRPTFHRQSQIRAFAAGGDFHDLHFYRDPKLTFGTLVTNLPISELDLPGRVD